MKHPMKSIKKWLASILTSLVIITLFGLIFIKSDLVKPTSTFFLELATVLGLTLMMKIFWYDYAEDKRLDEIDIKDAKDKYFKMVDDSIKDSTDLEEYLVILNQENRDHFINRKIGCRTAKTLSNKNWLMCLFHPSYRSKTKDEIGLIRYNKLYFKIQRKADKIRPVKSEEIIALADSELLYDSKNHLNDKKRAYQTVTTIVSFLFSTLLACLAMKEIALNWANLFRYVGYLCSLAWAIVSTIIKAYKQTGDETFDYLHRLRFIVDKYVTHSNKEATSDGDTIEHIDSRCE